MNLDSNTMAWIILGMFFGLGIGACFYEIVKTVCIAAFGKDRPEENRSAKP